MEFGASALGNRSILANPADHRVVGLINRMIKNRDFWMPFAPSVLREREADYLVNPKGLASPYMMLAFPTNPKRRDEIVAAIHPHDATARAHIVDEAWNPGYHRVLREFEARTGIGAVLNTSFNLHGEPLVCTLTAEQALAAAREAEDAVMRGRALGPLHGIPFTIKDLAFTKGVRTMSGSCIFAERVPDVDAPFVRRLLEAGGVLLGKTTTPEFGWKAIGDSPLTGISRNPWNPGMTTGGSSAGAGAAAAAGLGPLHQGSDGAGSIRIPSGFCGIYGLKPSYGRVPMWPISNNDYTSHVGPMTRTVA